MSRSHVGHPIAHCLVDRFFERCLARSDRNDCRAEKLHACDVERLALHVDDSHIDDTFEAKPGGNGRGGDPVLARPSFGNNPLLSHALAKQSLPDGIVDLVGSGVEKIFAF
jgi:hypothetical protein